MASQSEQSETSDLVSKSTSKPTLVYLHGVGQGDLKQEWKTNLSASLARIGYPTLDEVDVITPVYAGELIDSEEAQQSVPMLPLQKSPKLSSSEALEFERRRSALETRLGRHNQGAGGAIPEAVVSRSIDFWPFKQAKNYLNNQQIRARAHRRIVEQLPQEGEIVILGHSLGSVVAADLLRRLPKGLTVKGLVTLGSPLANDLFNVGDLFKNLHTPPRNLEWWVNFWSGTDPVSARRGVSVAIPWVLDFRVPTALIPGHAHSSREYCAAEAVAEAIGFGLFGSRSKEIVLLERNVEIPLDDTELFVVQALRYCYLIGRHLKDDTAERFKFAMQETQARFVHEVKTRNAQNNRPIPAEIAHLDFDHGDLEAVVPIPRTAPFMPKEQAFERLLDLLSQNLVHPFEIEIDPRIHKEVVQEFTSEMQLGSAIGTDAFEAMHKAQEIITGNKSNKKVNWRRWGAFGVGAAAITAATGGLVLAAAPGLAGAAVFTSALAGFGPGGMMGGIVTAGTLMTVGGGSLGLGALSSADSSEEVEALVVKKLSLALLWQKYNPDRIPEIWHELVESERYLRRELSRISSVSDANSPVLLGLKRKCKSLNKAVRYLEEQGQGSELDETESTGAASLKKLLSKKTEQDTTDD